MSSPPGKLGAARLAPWLGQRERGSGRLLRVYARLSRAVGRGPSRVLLRLVTAYYLLFAPRARRESRRYLRLALGREPRLGDVWRHLFSFATTIHDRVWLADGVLDPFEIEVEGGELLQEALASGEGALLIGAHLGSFEVVNAVGQRHAGATVAMAMYEENARKVRSMLDALQPRLRPMVIALGRPDAMLQIRDQLEHGRCVGLLADRTLGDEPVQSVPVLGRHAPLPLGPLRAAALLRRRVLFMTGLYLGANRYRVVFAPLADFRGTEAGERSERITEALGRYAALITGCCQAAPWNWFNFYGFWP